MKQIGRILIIFVIVLLVFGAFLPVSRPALAAACLKPGQQGPGEVVCNPAPGFFFDLQAIGKPDDIASLITYIIQAVLGIFGVLSIAFLIIGGFQYITARGNEEQAEAGKKTVTNAIIGLVIVIFSYVIYAVIVNALGGKV